MSLPTNRQQQVLDYIQSHIDNDGYGTLLQGGKRIWDHMKLPS